MIWHIDGKEVDFYAKILAECIEQSWLMGRE
jgi:hypothetical protein